MKLRFPDTLLAVTLGLSLLTTGCSSTPERTDLEGKMVVVPPMPEYKKEVTLAKLNEILGTMELSPEQRARFLYERGVVYDSVGLRLLARIDFHQALKIEPQLADAYNFLGIYYTQEGEYESAYEAFDGVLELAPDYDYAFLNRGIALYYGDRNELAVGDLQTFYQLQPQDGYRALWLYIVDSETDPESALANLAEHRGTLPDGAWSSALVDFYLGRLTKEQLFDLAKADLTDPTEYIERLCEAYFYLAKREMTLGNYQEATNYLKLALATNIYDFVEHRYARQELQKIRSILDAPAPTEEN
ncbi:lipoprotein NlpI [Shewanella corallii]|uniref:Lipoprotein NlpI n=2 Tax=Shewanella TaxID=22 RepID=A0ABT0N5I5_9GAMM|nr:MULTISPECIES: lipoprotein NlpI [Shewanella]MCL1037232.1 lipoprotein NlpI [Shewanella submarina]MCL2913721.1 lipoprotein NlpI [Shewanella corallii]